jgi:hypothetical protein
MQLHVYLFDHSSGPKLPDSRVDDGLVQRLVPEEWRLWLCAETCHHEGRDRLFQRQHKGGYSRHLTAASSYQGQLREQFIIISGYQKTI